MKSTPFFSKLVGAMLIVVLALVSMPVAQAYADVTAEIVPTANGNYTAWINDYAQIDEGIAGAVCDGGGPVDYISSATAGDRESVAISLASIPDGSTITSIDVLMADRGDTSEGGTYRTFVRFNGVDSADSAATHSATGTAGGCTGFPVDTFDIADTIKNAGTTLEIGVAKVNGIGLRVGVLSAIITYTYPEMDVQGNGISIANNDLTPTIIDGTNWGNVGLGIAVDRTFTILNTGTADLNLGAITFGAPGGDFSVVSTPAATVPPGGSTTFTVRLIPTAGGMALRSRTISIVNNDLDENPYTFLIQGTRVIGAPEIEVRSNDITIIDGDLTPSLADGTDFGTVTVGDNLIHTYTIRNNGDLVLNINTGSFVFTGDYTLETSPAATIPAGGSTTFQVRFTPAAGGVRNGSVRFDNDDPNELTYNFNLTGTGSTNTAPTTSGIGNVNVFEDAVNTDVDLWASFADAQDTDAQLTYTVQGNTNLGLFTSVTAPAPGGQFLILDYAPNAHGIAIITVRAMDTGGLSVDTTFTVTVTAINDEPDFTASNPAAVNEDAGAQTVVGWVTAIDLGPADEDISQSVLGYIISNSTCGTLLSAGPLVNAAGTLSYTPATDQNGSCTFDAQVQDNGGTANPGDDDTGPIHTFTITVNAADDASVAVDDIATVAEDDPATTIDVRGNDTDVDSTVELIQSVTQPVSGTVAITNAGADLTYQPDADYCNNGTPTDDFTYTLTGGSTATVAVTVTCVNDEPDFTAANPPAVNEDSGAQTVAGWVTAIDLGSADEDVSQNVLAYLISNSTCGTLLSVEPAVDVTGTLTYTVAANQNGTCTFDVQVQDDGGTVNPGDDDTGPIHTFTITVNAADDASVAVDDSATVAEDAAATTINVRGNDTDVDSAVELIQSVTQPVNGTVVITNAGADLTYQPDADYCNNGTPSDDFTYTLTGGSTATVTVTVTCVNDEPDFTAANPPAVNENSGAQTVAGWVTAIDLGPADEDVSQSVLGYIISNSTCGTLLSAGPAVDTAGTLTYTPAANQNGTCTFDAQLQDDGGIAGGGDDTSPIHAFTISVSAVPPVVDSIVRADPNPTNAANVDFNVTFSEDVTGVDVTDFTVTAGGSIIGASVTFVNGTGTTRTVTVNTGAGSGTIRLDVVDDDSIRDLANNPLGGTGVGNGNFNTGEFYTIDRGAPTIPTNGIGSIPDTGDGHVSEMEVVWVDLNNLTVTFSEDVFNPAGNTDPDDVTNPANYLLVRRGDSAFATTSCTGVVSPDVEVTIDSVAYDNNGGTGPFVSTLSFNGGNTLPNGFYRLIVCGSTSIVDLSGNALAGNGVTPGTDFTRNFLLFFGGAGGGGGGGGGTIAANAANNLPATGFAPGVVTNLAGPRVNYANSGITIELPRLKLKLPIVGVPYMNTGWNVDWLTGQVGWLEHTAFPGLNGNSVLTSHVTSRYGSAGPFAKLNKMIVGDMIFVRNNGTLYIYQVEQVLRIKSNDTSVFRHEEKSWLTLITCENFDEKSGTYLDRFVVRARLIATQADPSFKQ